MKARILIVDDDSSIRELIELYIRKEDWESRLVNDGDTALGLLKKERFDIVLLDIMMPGKDGFTVLRELRAFSDVPVIMLTARGESLDKVIGLDSGADDYVTKPFDTAELISRIKVILRRNTVKSGRVMTFEGLYVNLDNYTVKLDGKVLDMTPKEIELLGALVCAKNRVVPREELFQKVWNDVFEEGSRTLDVHIKRIRNKIGEGKNWRLATVWGIGYKFETEQA
jgi:DNA-binding response OmpR family regulator